MGVRTCLVLSTHRTLLHDWVMLGASKSDVFGYLDKLYLSIKELLACFALAPSAHLVLAVDINL